MNRALVWIYVQLNSFSLDVLSRAILLTPAIGHYHISSRKTCWTILNSAQTSENW